MIMIVLCIAIQSIVAYRLDKRLNTDGINEHHGQLLGPEITEAGKHILAKITEARAAKYSHLFVTNMNPGDAVKQVDQIVKLFQEITQSFDNQPCLRIEENLMGRTIEDNCYALITNRIVQTIAGKYELTVGEKAFMVTDSVTEKEIKYEFFLGPLYFGVYSTKA
ncbi:unnamed protein product [Medioppia subpectinata]|uniref:Uncharacterized protein n=1 Tax=Medioppia subpectinata TaxID=1979941 RepID=A0A7R9Q803_9ACAR|nr:unnamed protein product [Medioppia subpectinata]CAG2115341.1 unnamed protein product [Medioppia subpectinata]